jgi:putative ABC transport system permease protein
MGILRSTRSLVTVAAKRLTNNLVLTLCIIAGLTAAVALSTGIPIYSDAVNTKMLKEELSKEGRPPFSFLLRQIGSWTKPLEWDEYSVINDYISDVLPEIMDLPLLTNIRHAETDVFRLFPREETKYESLDKPLEWTSVGFVTGIQDHIDILEGDFPRPFEEGERYIEVLATQILAEKIGLQVGERYVLFGEEETTITGQQSTLEIPIAISGIWVAKDENDPFWFYQPLAFENAFLVAEPTYLKGVVPLLDEHVFNSVWYLIFDGDNLHIEDIPRFLNRITLTRSHIAAVRREVDLELSPESSMRKYLRESFNLTILLYVFSIPILGLVLYFISLISGMMVAKQRNEIALLRSRGTSSLQIVGIYLLESLLIGGLSITFGTILGRLLAQLMSNTQSLLRFVVREPMPTTISRTSMLFALAAVALAVVAVLLPVLSASKHTIVTYKRESARSLSRPFWQRYGIDFFLIILLIYGYYTLRSRGSIALFMEGEMVDNPFHNPLLFLIPALFVFALALVFLRLFPLLMESLARLSETHRGAPLVLALRSLARSSGHYSGPLLLVILTIGLASFTASMARTLDDHMVHKAYYESGGDFKLYELGFFVEPADAGESDGGESSSSTVSFELKEEEAEPHWEFLPVFDYLNVPGVLAATRVGSYKAQARWSEFDEGDLKMIGIDAQEFADVAFFREDFSGHELSKLLETLAGTNAALLVEKDFFERHQLQTGNHIALLVNMLGGYREIEFVVAGVIDYFPTAYPEDGAFFVANLEYLFAEAGGLFSYDVWLRVEEGLGAELLEELIFAKGLKGRLGVDARREIRLEQQLPERQGFFGLLSVGFLASAFLTALGFLIYTMIYFQRRSIELGVLRAIGLSVNQLIYFLVGEQLSLVTMGSAIGVFLGAITSLLFIPFLQVGSDSHPQTPPFIVQIAWLDISKILAIFGAMLVVVIAIMVWLLIRMKIYKAVKLEEVT